MWSVVGILLYIALRFDVAGGPVLVQGALMDVDDTTGRATAMRRIRERVIP